MKRDVFESIFHQELQFFQYVPVKTNLTDQGNCTSESGNVAKKGLFVYPVYRTHHLICRSVGCVW